MIGVYDGKTFDVRATCEVVIAWAKDGQEAEFCNRPTTRFYPASGGGSWSRKDRPRVDEHPTQTKLRWELSA